MDSSVLLAYFLGEKTGQTVKDQVFGNPKLEAFASHLALSETFYILCRNRGEEYASTAMKTLESTGYLKIQESAILDYAAAHYKCERNINLADCYVLALAKNINGTALFARREIDIEKENKRSPFEVPLLFAEEISR